MSEHKIEELKTDGSNANIPLFCYEGKWYFPLDVLKCSECGEDMFARDAKFIAPWEKGNNSSELKCLCVECVERQAEKDP